MRETDTQTETITRTTDGFKSATGQAFWDAYIAMVNGLSAALARAAAEDEIERDGGGDGTNAKDAE